MCGGAGGEGVELHAETAPSSLTVIFKLIMSGLTSLILNGLDRVNLQFQHPLFPFLCDYFSELWQLQSWVQAGHHAVNFCTWCFGVCKTAQDITYSP